MDNIVHPSNQLLNKERLLLRQFAEYLLKYCTERIYVCHLNFVFNYFLFRFLDSNSKLIDLSTPHQCDMRLISAFPFSKLFRTQFLIALEMLGDCYIFVTSMILFVEI